MSGTEVWRSRALHKGSAPPFVKKQHGSNTLVLPGNQESCNSLFLSNFSLSTHIQARQAQQTWNQKPQRNPFSSAPALVWMGSLFTTSEDTITNGQCCQGINQGNHSSMTVSGWQYLCRSLSIAAEHSQCPFPLLALFPFTLAPSHL